MEPYVFIGKALAQYGFGHDHPFGPDRHDAFVSLFHQQGLDRHVKIRAPADTTREIIERFHTEDYLQRVIEASHTGQGFLDCGDTPAHLGIYDIAKIVVGTTLEAANQIMDNNTKRAFIPIAGLHHARRDIAAGFCVFNDCGVLIETLRKVHNIVRIAYVDIDAHHGDGVFYEYINDPDLIFVDFHEDGRFLYPGTGNENETGKGAALGTKLNIPMPPGADDGTFLARWDVAESFIARFKPEFILFQCGADSLAGDPITHLCYSEKTHAFVCKRLCLLANKFSNGRILAMGGGGYNRDNLARAWCAVVNELIETPF